MIDAKCGTCDAPMRVRPYRVAQSASGMVFCSYACQHGNPEIRASRRAKRRTGVTIDCEVCGKSVYRIRAEAARARFCSYECAGKAAIKRGTLHPAPKGISRSPATQFKPGVSPTNREAVGTVRIRHRRKRQDVRAYVKVAEPNWWLPRAIVVWETARGQIPRGSVIHHHDWNSLNDDLSNLRCLTRREHIAVHRSAPLQEHADAVAG